MIHSGTVGGVSIYNFIRFARLCLDKIGMDFGDSSVRENNVVVGITPQADPISRGRVGIFADLYELNVVSVGFSLLRMQQRLVCIIFDQGGFQREPDVFQPTWAFGIHKYWKGMYFYKHRR